MRIWGKMSRELKTVSRRINLGSGPLRHALVPAFHAQYRGANSYTDRRSPSLKRLYVGNLPFQATEEQLTALFTQTGVTAANVTLVRGRFSGQPRGFGFVEINNDEEAERAVQGLNGHDFM